MYGKALEIKPMRIWKLPKEKGYMKSEVCNSGDYFGQIKKDGYFYSYEKDIDGNSFLFSRDISVKTGHLTEKSANVPHIMKALDAFFSNGTIIIGEIRNPKHGTTSRDVGKVMGAKPEKAIATQEKDGWLSFYMHDALMLNGKNFVTGQVTNWDRYMALVDAIAGSTLLDDNKCLELARSYTDNLEERIDQAFENGEEGMVLKLKNGLYCPDKKPAWNMIKFKIEDDFDVVSMGFEPPKRLYDGKNIEEWQFWEDGEPVSKPYAKGWIGAIVIGAYDKNGELVKIGTVSSGLTDSICEEIKLDQDKFLNKPLAVRCMQAYEGALRHPVFVRFRDDLNLSDCTMEKIFE